MKHRHEQPAGKRPAPSEPAAGASPAPATPPLPLSRGRKLLFASVLLLLVPALLLGLLELGLRVGSYGYNPNFFKLMRIGGEEVLVENDKFGLRFFPPEMARSPAPVVMRANKPAGTFRVFILGESAALGDPKPAYGVGRYLSVLLRERFPGAEFEVVCVGVTAINSHVILPIARECAGLEGDLWIVYMGNNEMVGPFGAMTVFGSQAPPLPVVRLSLAIQRTRIGQLGMAAIRRVTSKSQPGTAWGGMKMFLENRVPPDDPRRRVVYENFSRNLNDILRAGQRSGAQVLLSSVAVNLSDCAPFGSVPTTNLLAGEQVTFDHFKSTAAAAESAGDYALAAGQYRQAAKLAPKSAEIQFRLGTSLLRTTNSAQAQEHFARACDWDTVPFRADSFINGAVAAARQSSGADDLIWCDSAALLAARSSSGVPGREAFYEHVHLTGDGNYQMARAWAELISLRLPASITNRLAGPWASQEICERRLGLTDWNRYLVLEEVQRRLGQPPFTDQLNHAEQMERLRAQMSEVRSRLTPAAAQEARALHLEALERAPRDHRLHENYAEFLEETGDLAGAAAQWESVRELIPQHHVAYFQSGRLLARTGKLKEARPPLEQAVTLRPDLAEGWLELGHLDAKEERFEAALANYDRERQLAPRDHRVFYHIGKVYSKLKRREEALEYFRQALKLRPTYWEARYALGEELAFAGEVAAARREFEEVIRQQPNFAMAHLNLGVSLVQQGQLQEALGFLETAARLDPQNKLAADYANQVRTRLSRLSPPTTAPSPQ